MTKKQQLSDEEFVEMVGLLHRHVETDMDQWELWSFDSSRGKIYINVSLKADGPDTAYDDLNLCLRSSD